MRARDEQLNLFDPLLDTVAALVVVLDSDGKIVRFNKACQELTGYAENEAVGKSLFDLLIPPDELDDVRPVFDELKGGDFPNSHTNAWLTKAGDKRLIQWSNGVKLSADGEIAYILGTGIDVTDKQYALNQLQEMQQRFGRAVSAGRIAVWELDVHSGVRERFGRLWEDEPEEFKLEAKFEETRQDVHPDDRDWLRKQFDSFLEGEVEAHDAEFRIVRPNGQEKWVHVQADADRDADGNAVKVVGTVQDITDRKKQELGFTERQRYLTSLLETSPVAVIRISEQAVIEDFSPAARRLFGYEPDEIVGKKVNDLMPEPYRSEHDGYIERYLTTGEKRIIGIGRKVPAARKDGTVFPMWLSVGEIDVEGDRHFVGFVQDRSDTEQAQAKIAELQQELQQVARLTAMGEIAAAIAHELNQPLTAASSFTEAAKLILESDQTNASKRAGELLGKGTKEILRSGQIIKRIRQFVSSDEGNREIADVNSVVKEAGELGLVGSASADINVMMKLDDHNPAANIDSVQIQQVLINLMRNAMDAMTETEEKQLGVTTSIESEDIVKVSVTDTGSGIEQSVVNRLFEPFVTTKTSGMGIGLSVCKTIIESHGGDLWAEPNAPRGTVFSFTVPLAKNAKDHAG